MSVAFDEKTKFGERAEIEVADDGQPKTSAMAARRMSRRGSVLNTTAAPPPDNVLVNSDRAYSVVAENLPDFADLHDEMRENTNKEVSLGFFKGLKTYPTAAAWSVILSSSIIMEGYDTALLGSFFAYPSFNRDFGSRLPSGEFQVSAQWQAGLMNGAQAGSMLGLALNGIMCDLIGFRKTYFIALVMMTGAIFLSFFASGSIPILMAGQVLSGVPWGMFQTLSVAYASEVCPVCLRGYLTTYANLCWVIGQLLSMGILRGMLSMEGQWGYRIPFALQWIFPPPLFIALIWAPESPWWLVRQGRMDEAAKVVKRLMSKKEAADPQNISNKLAEMKLTNEHEKALSAGTQYWDCFKGIDLRRTEVATVTWACQNLCGSAFMAYSTYFYKQAGLPTERAFDFSIGQYALGFIGTIGSWVLMSYWGRRSLYMIGLAVLCLILLGIGGAGFAPPNATIIQTKRAEGIEVRINKGASWAVGSLLLVYTLIYDFTVGPVCYAIVAETSSTRLRQKTIVLARMLYNVVGIINNFLIPAQLNPGAWNWGSKAALFWSGICFLCVIWCYFRLPETKDRTYNELTILFENKISARKFKGTKVDAFRSKSIAVQQGMEA
ncbi:hypothetical protein DV735_g1899, partial [Chaetothyriales sp. CBS 134920]